MRYVTFYYDLLNNRASDIEVHEDKETALKHFNKKCHSYFRLNTPFKATKTPVTYGYPLRKYYGVSATYFKKMFGVGIDEALKLAKEGKA